MQQQSIANGGVQHVPQIAVQYVYLDFDGELTDYNGEILTIEGVEVRDPQLTQARIADILAELNKKYASQNVIFVTERPANAEYSTIFIGKTEAFDQYGNFAGLAETVDFNNQNRSDNAFVNLDSTATDEQIISTISHETDHLLGTLAHGGEGLNAYAARTIIYAGTTSTGLVISSGNSITVSSGGIANNTTVNSGGFMYIYSDGEANSTTVNYSGFMCISSGGNATAIRENGGYVDVANGANVTFVSNTITGLTLLYDSMTVHQNTVANNTTLSGGYMYIYSGGVANRTTVNDWGDMYIYSGGVANRTTLSGGYSYYESTVMYINSGGVANSTTVDSYGYMSISSGGVANNTTVHGYMFISSGGVANSTTVNWGSMRINSGGVANSTTVDSYGYMSISSGGVANSTTVNDWGSMHINSGGVANGTTVNNFDGDMDISSGGVANSTTVNSGGRMYIESGGTANSTTVNWGSMHINSGGVANSTTVNDDGFMYICSGGTAAAIKENGGCVNVANGANVTFVSNTLEGLTLSFYTSMTVHQNTVANSTTVNSGGRIILNSGGVANSTTVNDDGFMYICSGGVANSTTVNYWGDMSISSGGVANSTTVNDWGFMSIYSGGVANDTTMNDGYMDINSGGVANRTMVISSGRMYISSGGTANSTTVNSSGSMYISSGGVANSTTLSGGRMYIESGGTANSTTVRGYMGISSGGMAKNTTVNSGWMYISSGGVHRGTLQINSGATVSAYNGAAIDFTLTGRSASSGYLINDLGSILGNPSYTITISGSQSKGTYKLAQGAEDFTGTVTIGTNGKNYGTLRVNGSALCGSTNAYRLTENDGNLQLTISDNKAELNISNYQVSKSSIATSESVKLTFTINNTGTKTAGASTLKVYDGDTLLRTVSLDSIAAGSSRNCTVTVTAGKLTAGSHKLYVVADANNSISELNENNNRAYRTVNVVKRPDLRMAEINLSKNSITTKESVKLTFKVHNDGDTKAAASTIKVYDGDKLLREVALGEIAAKGYRNCTITLVSGKLSAGTHKINVVLDSENIITESNENNNNSYRTIFVKKAPDLRMAEYNVSSNSITTQESVKLTFKVYNDGDVQAPASTIKVYDGDRLLREVALGEIDAKGYRNCTITLTSGKLSVGTHKINVVLDSENIIAEASETNNNSYRTIFVKEPVRSLAAAPKENNSWDVCGTGSVDILCGGNYADLNEWSLENSAALTRSAADILTTDKEESRLLNSGKLAG